MIERAHSHADKPPSTLSRKLGGAGLDRTVPTLAPRDILWLPQGRRRSRSQSSRWIKRMRRRGVYCAYAWFTPPIDEQSLYLVCSLCVKSMTLRVSWRAEHEHSAQSERA